MKPKTADFRVCLWCPHTSKRPLEFLLYLQADEVAHYSESLCNLPATALPFALTKKKAHLKSEVGGGRLLRAYKGRSRTLQVWV